MHPIFEPVISARTFESQVPMPNAQINANTIPGTGLRDEIIYADRVYFSGITARDLSGDIGAQTRDVLAIIDARLSAVGSNRNWLLTAHVNLRNMALVQEMNAVWNAWVDADKPPSRTCVSGGLMPAGALVEIVVTAAIPEPGQAPGSIERYGLVQGTGRPSICLGLAYREWFSVCMTAPDRSADISGQAHQVLERLEGYLVEAGTDKTQVLTAELWLKRTADYDAMNAVWDSWINFEHPPARVCVRADMARPESLVEIRITAAR